LTKGQKIGLKHFEDFEMRIPRKVIEEIEKFLRKEIHNLDPKYEITICGSFRRGLPTSGDIDVLLTHDKVSKNEKN
jgi:DNA polymerase/3'-5' exonuclease PolX